MIRLDRMFFSPRAITALYALTQINHARSQDLPISQISTHDSDRLRQVLEYGCSDIHEAPMTDLEVTRLRTTDLQEVLAQHFLADDTNPELREYRSQIITQLSQIVSHTQDILSKRINVRVLVNNLHALEAMLVSHNMAWIHPEINTLISTLQAQTAVMISREHLNRAEESVYDQLPNPQIAQLLQFTLHKLEIACTTKESMDRAYHSYCRVYFQWEKDVLATAYQQLMQASTPAEKTLLKIIMQKHRTYLLEAFKKCKTNASRELLELLDAASQEIGQSDIQINEGAQQL